MHTRCVEYIFNIFKRALKELSSINTYRDNFFCINEEWNHVLLEGNASSTQNEKTNTKIDTNDELDNENATETLIHGLLESQRIHDLQEKIVELMLVEGKCPLGIFKEKYPREMKFPTFLYGYPHDDDIKKLFSYQKILKWEFLQASGDFSCHIKNVFFETM